MENKNENNYGVIYCLTNEINNKQYFGQTTKKNVDVYWKSKQKGNNYINRAIRKYGWDNFNKEVICSCGDKLSLGLMEDFCIQVFNTLSPNGYNLMRGGIHGKASEETLQKMSKAQKGENNPMYGKKRLDTSKRMLGEGNPNYGKFGELSSMYGVHRYGKDNPMFGKKQSKESRKLMSDKGKKWHINHPRARKGENNPNYKHGKYCKK